MPVEKNTGIKSVFDLLNDGDRLPPFLYPLRAKILPCFDASRRDIMRIFPAADM